MFNKKIFNEIVIDSNKKSIESHNGSLTTNGGIGIKRNLIVDEDILGKDLKILNNSELNNVKINNNLDVQNINIKNNLDVQNITTQTISTDKFNSSGIEINDKDIIIKKNINGKNINIGNEKQRINTIKSTLIDTNEINISNTRISDKETIINSDTSINGILNINKGSNNVLVRGNISTNIISIENFIKITPQIIKLNNKITKVNLESSLVFIDLYKKGTIEFIISDIIKGSIVKIYIRKIKISDNELLKIIMNDTVLIFDQSQRYVELYIDDEIFVL
jgi:hypothetical protein